MIDPLIGKLGPYLFIERIGAGGMGAVYRAIHQTLDQPRAVEGPPPALGADPAFVARFMREARTAARLDIRTSCRCTTSVRMRASTISRWSWSAADRCATCNGKKVRSRCHERSGLCASSPPPSMLRTLSGSSIET